MSNGVEILSEEIAETETPAEQPNLAEKTLEAMNQLTSCVAELVNAMNNQTPNSEPEPETDNDNLEGDL